MFALAATKFFLARIIVVKGLLSSFPSRKNLS